MKLQRLKVAELRRFRQPFELADIQPGLNIFCGPNESGKSTLVRALRAAFFERHRSTVVDDLRPFGDSSAAPQVELDFEVDGTPYRLVKRFLARKRCDLLVGSQAFEGQAAEDLLARLLGFQFAAKGVSREEHWGIPGLLWINQGAGHELRDAVGHAHDHLRQALDQSVGDVAASGGDELLAQVRRLHDELLTATGKPRAELQRAIDDEARLQQAVADLQQQVATYRGQVDQLNQLRSAQADDAQAQPWLALRQQQASAQQALQAVAALAQDRERLRDQLRQASGLRQLLAQALVDADQQQQALPQRQAALAAAQARHDQAAALQAQQKQAAALQQQRLQAAGQALASARQEDLRHNLARQLVDAQTRAAELKSLLARAQAEADRSAALKRQAAPLRIAPADLKALRQQQAQLTELQIRQQAVATRLRFELSDGARITLDGQPLTGQGERLLLTGSSLLIAGIGRLDISPGGQDLAALHQAQATLQADHQALLQRLGLASLAEAEARELNHARQLAEAAAADQAAQLLAPKGLAVLQQGLDAAQARQAEAAAALARLPPVAAPDPLTAASGESASTDVEDTPDRPSASNAVTGTTTSTTTSTGTTRTTTSTATTTAGAHAAAAAAVAAAASTAASLADAERNHEACRADAEAALQQWQAARQALASAASQLDAAQREHQALQTQLADPQRLASLADKRQSLVQASARQEALEAALADIDQRIAAARPDILQQDVDRLRRSADEAERQHQARDRQIVQLESTLAAAGAQGLEEELAGRDSALTQARQRLDQLRRRADALALLLQRLQQHRQVMTRRLQAPLQLRLDHYLPLLLPSARVQVDDALLPGSLTRPGPQGNETAELDSLSFGAREQMGLISRLAYADLLQQAGRPTLVVLDDALVHSDAQRLALMKRVLFDAAQRHQVLLFTCHPADWRDMGVPLRALQPDA